MSRVMASGRDQAFIQSEAIDLLGFDAATTYVPLNHLVVPRSSQYLS